VNEEEETMIVAEASTLPVWEATGEARVDAALELLIIAEELPLEEQPPVFEEMHQRLRSALTAESDSQ
jgi:hypothetical protein